MGIKDSAELAWQDWQAAPGSTGPKTTGPLGAVLRRVRRGREGSLAARAGDGVVAFRHQVDELVVDGVASRRSSRCPAPSRTPTSPAGRFCRCWAACGQGRPRRLWRCSQDRRSGAGKFARTGIFGWVAQNTGRTCRGSSLSGPCRGTPVRIDSHRQQRCPLLGGVRAAPRHLGVADHQRDHLDSLSDKPPVREFAPNTPYATLSPTHAV